MLAAVAACARIGIAAPLVVPNASFETPTNSFVSVDIDSWQKTPKPDWYVENGGFLWSQLVGGFRNTTATSPDHIDNCDGNQAIWLFAVPEVGLFQDYDSVDWNDTEPTHAFDARFNVGKGYRLAFGIFVGTSAGVPMQDGVTMEASLYYRDASSNRVIVAATTVTNTGAVTANQNHFLDFRVTAPPVQGGDAWAGQNIGIQLLSTVESNMQGGYWVVDHIRLTEFEPPALTSPARVNGQFQFQMKSEPGFAFEILAAEDATFPASTSASLAVWTNVSGTATFVDTNAGFGQRYYRASLLP